MNVECPEGVCPGDAIVIATEWGDELEVAVPVRTHSPAIQLLPSAADRTRKITASIRVDRRAFTSQEGVAEGEEFTVVVVAPPGWGE